MNELVKIEGTPDELAVMLRSMATMSAIAIGIILKEAKRQVAHGEWKEWIRINFGDYSKAVRLMRCAEAFTDDQQQSLISDQAMAFINPSALYQLASEQEELREEIIARAEKGELISVDTIAESKSVKIDTFENEKPDEDAEPPAEYAEKRRKDPETKASESEWIDPTLLCEDIRLAWEQGRDDQCEIVTTVRALLGVELTCTMCGRSDEVPKPKTRKPSEKVIAAKFTEFWDCVHRKTAKGAAKKAFSKACLALMAEMQIEFEDASARIIEAMKMFALSPQARDEIKGQLHPATWLSQERYLDDTEIWHDSADNETERQKQNQEARRERINQIRQGGIVA